VDALRSLGGWFRGGRERVEESVLGVNLKWKEKSEKKGKKIHKK
jgi:hypothetical protein